MDADRKTGLILEASAVAAVAVFAVVRVRIMRKRREVRIEKNTPIHAVMTLANTLTA